MQMIGMSEIKVLNTVPVFFFSHKGVVQLVPAIFFL